MDNNINNILQKIEKIAEEKADEIEQQNFEKYKDLFELTVKFLTSQKILLYGGFAINELMPKNMKIYKTTMLPDIDFFTYKPKEIATNMVKYFHRVGFTTSSFTEALHPGTYKVFVHGLQVADITGVSPKAFKRLAKNAVRGSSGLTVVDPQYLRMTLHLLMSQANDSHRWSKVFARLVSFYKMYPPKKCGSSGSGSGATKKGAPELPAGLEDSLYSMIEKEKYVLFGAKELQMMLDDPEFAHASRLPRIQILCQNDAEIVATNVIKEHPSYALTAHVFEKDDFMPRHVFLRYKNQNVLGIYEASACVTFNTLKKYRVASIHTMLRMYLSMTFASHRHFEQALDAIECITGSLAYLQQHMSKHRRRRILQEFVLDCYGAQAGLVTLRREKLLRFA